jgi:glucokinase
MTDIVVADVGGTNARFAIATLDGPEPRLSEIRRYDTADHSSLASAWRSFASDLGRSLPRAASIAVAGGLGGDVVKLANCPWIVRPSTLADELGLDRLTLVNDFGAMAHAVDALADDSLEWIAGPRSGRPAEGVISVIGPGTGLGVAMVLRRAGHHHVIETEGGHIDFAPLDTLEEQILARLRSRHLRVSVERIVSGPGLANIYEAIASIEGTPARIRDDASLWAAATDGSDPLASAALDRLCMSFGSVAGDLALAQGASAVVITSQLARRVVDRLRGGAFVERFLAKGRYRSRMEAMPVLLCRHPEPGLYGAAAAFQKEHMS